MRTYVLVTFALIITSIDAACQKVPAPVTTFDQYPDKINCNTDELDSLLSLGKDQNTILSLGNTFNAKGKIIRNKRTNQNKQLVSIRLPELNNSVCSISKYNDETNHIIYKGRILDMNSKDGYELKHIDERNYQFIKINMTNILQSCTLE